MAAASSLDDIIYCFLFGPSARFLRSRSPDETDPAESGLSGVPKNHLTRPSSDNTLFRRRVSRVRVPAKKETPPPFVCVLPSPSDHQSRSTTSSLLVSVGAHFFYYGHFPGQKLSIPCLVSSMPFSSRSWEAQGLAPVTTSAQITYRALDVRRAMVP